MNATPKKESYAHTVSLWLGILVATLSIPTLVGTLKEKFWPSAEVQQRKQEMAELQHQKSRLEQQLAVKTQELAEQQAMLAAHKEAAAKKAATILLANNSRSSWGVADNWEEPGTWGVDDAWRGGWEVDASDAEHPAR